MIAASCAGCESAFSRSKRPRRWQGSLVYPQEEPVDCFSDAVPVGKGRSAQLIARKAAEQVETHPRSAEMGNTPPSLTFILPTMSLLNICLMSSTAIAPSQSCLLASTRVGTPSTLESVTISSARGRARFAVWVSLIPGNRERENERTKDGPALFYPFLVGRVDHKHDGVAFCVVFRPDAPDVALPCVSCRPRQFKTDTQTRSANLLTAEIPKLEDGRRQGDSADCGPGKWLSANSERGTAPSFPQKGLAVLPYCRCDARWIFVRCPVESALDFFCRSEAKKVA